MTKRKKKPDPLEQFLKFIKDKAKDASIRDLAYLASYVSAVFLAYEYLEGVTPWVSVRVVESMKSLGLLPYGFTINIPKEEKPFNVKHFTMAMVIAYMILKIDVSDVKSAVTALGRTAMTALAGASPAPLP